MNGLMIFLFICTQVLVASSKFMIYRYPFCVIIWLRLHVYNDENAVFLVLVGLHVTLGLAHFHTLIFCCCQVYYQNISTRSGLQLSSDSTRGSNILLHLAMRRIPWQLLAWMEGMCIRIEHSLLLVGIPYHRFDLIYLPCVTASTDASSTL